MTIRVPVTAPARRPAPSGLTAWGLLLIAASAVVTAIALSSALVNDQIVWGAVALALLCAGLLALMASAVGYGGLGLGTWRLGPWLLAWGALSFGLATISWLEWRPGAPAEILPESILRAEWMIGAAMMTVTIGYCFGPYRLVAWHMRRGASTLLTRRFSDNIRGPVVPWALFAVGLLALLAFTALTGRFGYVGNAAASVATASGYAQYLAIAGECVPLAVAAATVRAYQTRQPKEWLTVAVLLTAAILVGSAAGVKLNFIVAILALLIPRAALRRRVPVGTITAAVAFFLLIVIPFTLAYRTSARGAVTRSASQAVAAAPSIARQVVSTDLSPAVFSQSAGYLAQRVRSIDSPAIIIQRTPSQIPYSSPIELVTAPFIDLIPRILWPGKPVLAVGYQMSQEYFQLPPQEYTSTGVTPEGDLYRHGGWVPLVAGMFLLGCGLRVLDEVADLRRGVHGAFLIILLFPPIVQDGTDWATLVAGFPGQVLLWLVVVSLSFSRRPAPAVVRRALPSASAARS